MQCPLVVYRHLKAHLYNKKISQVTYTIFYGFTTRKHYITSVYCGIHFVLSYPETLGVKPPARDPHSVMASFGSCLNL